MSDWHTLAGCGALPPNRVLIAFEAIGQQVLDLNRSGIKLLAKEGNWQLLWKNHDNEKVKALGALASELGTPTGKKLFKRVHKEIVASELLSIQNGILSLLLEQDSGNEVGSKLNGQLMIVVQNKNVESVAEIAETLESHCRYLRIRTAKAEDGEKYYLFHIQDHAENKSSLDAYLKSKSLSYSKILFPHGSHGRQIFLPAAIPPAREYLNSVLTLCKNVPQLFGINLSHGEKAKHGIQFALTDKERAPQGRKRQSVRGLYLFPLASEPFLDRTVVWPPSRKLKVEEVRLDTDKKAIQRLQDQIANLPPDNTGYRLNLMQLRNDLPGKQEIEHIVDEIQRLQDRRDWLLSRRMDLALIYRFEQRQIAAAADLLRRYSPRALQSGEVRYAYQTTSKGNYHYIYIEAPVFNPHPPVTKSAGLEGSPTRVVFRVDPYWAKYLNRASRKPLSRVYVPDGYGLFPTLAAWSDVGMDEYLKQVITNLWTGDTTLNIPEKSIYLFDVDNDGISLDIIDADEFVSLDQSVIKWINENVAVNHIYEKDMAASILADTALKKKVAEEALKEEQQMERRVVEYSQLVYSQCSDQIDILLNTMSKEAEKLAEEAEKYRTELGELNDQAQAVKDLYHFQQGHAPNKVEDLSISASAKAKILTDKKFQKAIDTKQEITKAVALISDISNTAGKTIERLDNTVRDLKAQLKAAVRR